MPPTATGWLLIGSLKGAGSWEYDKPRFGGAAIHVDSVASKFFGTEVIYKQLSNVTLADQNEGIHLLSTKDSFVRHMISLLMAFFSIMVFQDNCVGVGSIS